jgi:hypothetical protein
VIKKMNDMKLKKIYSCLLLVAIFLSCQKEEQVIIVNPGVSMLSSVLIDKQLFNEYKYSNVNLISEEKSKFDYTLHQYNDKNQLLSTDYYGNNDILSSDLLVYESALNRKEWVTPMNGTKGGTIKYDYNSNGELIKTTYSRPLNSSSEYSEFSYDANNRISRQIMYWENVKTGYTDYSYDAKGNLIKEILNSVSSTGVAELSTTILYEFDNQKNPYESFSKSKIPGINTNSNNIVKETYTIHLGVNQGTEKIQVTETSYKYNGNGYPVSKNNNVEYIYK